MSYAALIAGLFLSYVGAPVREGVSNVRVGGWEGTHSSLVFQHFTILSCPVSLHCEVA